MPRAESGFPSKNNIFNCGNLLRVSDSGVVLYLNFSGEIDEVELAATLSKSNNLQ